MEEVKRDSYNEVNGCKVNISLTSSPALEGCHLQEQGTSDDG